MSSECLRSTPHAHTTFVDGKSSAAEMVLWAIAKNFRSLGFSEHGVQEFDTDCSLHADSERRYIAQIKRLQAQYADALRVHLGIERDLYALVNRADYEYVVGSVHYFRFGEEYIAIDGAREQLDRCFQEHFSADGMQMARAYYDLFAGYIESYRPEIIAHFDLLRKHNIDARYFDPEDARYRALAFEALERMRPSDALLEINTGGMARGSASAPYPADTRLLRFWRERGGRVILSSDCHDATKLDYGFPLCVELLRAAGYTSAWVLGTSAALFEEFPL